MLLIKTPFEHTKASFKTHLNYIKCLEKMFSACDISTTKTGTFTKNNTEISRFKKLYDVTLKSIRKDIELAREDPDFAVIIAPWFPVKCYYALYYLESILIHLVDGSMHGFGKGGHTGVRKKIYSLVSSNKIIFNQVELNTVYPLTQINSMPAINSGQNTRSDYWDKPECIQSVVKKLLDYKIHDAHIGRKWNLHTKKDKGEKKQFIISEKLMISDFFYWYRIKANYRDLDYIDFENGIDSTEVLEYIEIYNKAFESYRSCLSKNLNILIK